MKKIPVNLNGMEEVADFVDIINKFDYNCDLCCGSYFVDAKSLLGVAVLQGGYNVELVIHADCAEDLIRSVERYKLLK